MDCLSRAASAASASSRASVSALAASASETRRRISACPSNGGTGTSIVENLPLERCAMFVVILNSFLKRWACRYAETNEQTPVHRARA